MQRSLVGFALSLFAVSTGALAACASTPAGPSVDSVVDAAVVPDVTQVSLADAGADAQHTCPSARGDCDGLASNGCETKLASAHDDCGACGHACAATEVCDRGQCGVTCAAGRVGCGGECTDVARDPENCGGCGRKCPSAPHGVPACSRAVCTLSCDSGFTPGQAGCEPTVAGLGNINALTVSVSGSGACVLVGDAVKCWGIGFPRSNLPASLVGFGQSVSAISDAGDAFCGVVSGGVTCARMPFGPNPPRPPANNVTALPVAQPGLHMCAIVSGGVKCWGSNMHGELGYGQNPDSNTPVQVEGITSGATALAVHAGRSCAIVGGALKCWGYGQYGELGDGLGTNSKLPVQVNGMSSGVTAVAIGEASVCAVVNGAAKCWGEGRSGQLGNGRAASSLVPIEVPGLSSGVTAIAHSGAIGCAIVRGAVKCWGNAAFGGIGNGTTNDAPTPVQVVGLTSGASAIAVSPFNACAVVSGAVYCWGAGADGMLGNGRNMDSLVPVQVRGL
jgi:hypothetical protein